MSKVTVVKFSKDNCRPCHMLAGELAKIDFNAVGVNLVEYNVSKPENMYLIDDYRLSSAPVLVIEVDGKEVERIHGYVPAEVIIEKLYEIE